MSHMELVALLSCGLVMWMMVRQYDKTINGLRSELEKLCYQFGERCGPHEQETRALRKEVQYLRRQLN